MVSNNNEDSRPSENEFLGSRRHWIAWALGGGRRAFVFFPDNDARWVRGIATTFIVCLATLAITFPGLAQTKTVAITIADSQSQTKQIESYGSSKSSCEEIPYWKPNKRILLFPAQNDGTEGVQSFVLKESLQSYLIADVTIIALSAYSSELLADVDGIVVFGNGAFEHQDQIHTMLSEAKVKGIPLAWIGFGAENFASELGLNFLSPKKTPKVGQVQMFEYNGVDLPTAELAFSPFLAPDTEAAEQVLATISTPSGESVPAIISTPPDLAYVGYIPFFGRNSSLPFVAAIDAISRLFGPRIPDRRVLFRLEDINAKTYGPDDNVFDAVTGFLLEHQVFIHLAIIPENVSQNSEDEEESVDMDIGAAKNVVRLTFEHPEAVEIIQHGYRHYRKDPRNASCPRSGTGCAFEFFEDDDATMGPEAAAQLARERMLAGRDVLSRHLLTPMVFEAPHYVMSPAQTAVAEGLYPLIMQEPLFYKSRDGGFFLPWFTLRENANYAPSAAGYVALDEPRSVENILADLEDLARILPDPVVTVFFHPFIYNLDGRQEDLKRLVTGIEGLGYRFASACEELSLRK